MAKIAVTARDVCDVPAVLSLLQRHAAEAPLIALAMGEEGVSSRILAGKFGAFLTYASLSAGAGSAPGQVPYDQMLGLYRFRQIGPATAVYGVVANPVAHSMSPAIHNTAFAALGLDAVYLPFKVTDCAGFLAGFEPFDLKGLSVTIPHKETMLGLMDEVDELGRSIGAINTMKITDGHRYGCNTDLAACVAAMEDAARRAGLEMARCQALIVGGGGAARAFAHGLRAKVAGLTIANRTVERGVRVAEEVGAASCGLDEMTGLRPDIIVNATSVGMWPKVDATPVPASMLRPGMAVVESVYNPVQTRLLREAEAAGATTATGLGWFVDQAAAQCELWTGREAPREVMEQVSVRTAGWTGKRLPPQHEPAGVGDGQAGLQDAVGGGVDVVLDAPHRHLAPLGVVEDVAGARVEVARLADAAHVDDGPLPLFQLQVRRQEAVHRSPRSAASRARASGRRSRCPSAGA